MVEIKTVIAHVLHKTEATLSTILLNHKFTILERFIHKFLSLLLLSFSI